MGLFGSCSGSAPCGTGSRRSCYVIHCADGVRAPLPVLLANCFLHKISDHVF